MKLIFYIFIQFIFAYHEFGNAQSVKDQINAAIDDIRNDIPEPITIDSLDIEMPENDFISGELDVSNVKLTGIKEFDIVIGYLLNIIPNTFTVTLDYIELNTQYLSDLTLLDIPLLNIFGQGNALIALENLIVQGTIDYSLIPTDAIQSMKISLGDAKFQFDGLLNDETFSNDISDYLTKNFANLFNQYSDDIAGVAQGLVNNIINDLLTANATVTDPSENVPDLGEDVPDSNGNVGSLDNETYSEVIVLGALNTFVEKIKSVLNN